MYFSPFGPRHIVPAETLRKTHPYTLAIFANLYAATGICNLANLAKGRLWVYIYKRFRRRHGVEDRVLNIHP